MECASSFLEHLTRKWVQPPARPRFQNRFEKFVELGIVDTKRVFGVLKTNVQRGELRSIREGLVRFLNLSLPKFLPPTLHFGERERVPRLPSPRFRINPLSIFGK